MKSAESIICLISTRNIRARGCCVLDGKVLEGEIPRAKMKLLDAWLEIHREELEANWKLISSGEQVFRIDPLK